jgi:hypothetical protein
VACNIYGIPFIQSFIGRIWRKGCPLVRNMATSQFTGMRYQIKAKSPESERKALIQEALCQLFRQTLFFLPPFLPFFKGIWFRNTHPT